MKKNPFIDELLELQDTALAFMQACLLKHGRFKVTENEYGLFFNGWTMDSDNTFHTYSVSITKERFSVEYKHKFVWAKKPCKVYQAIDVDSLSWDEEVMNSFKQVMTKADQIARKHKLPAW